MNDTKTIFQANKDLTEKWLGVCREPWFQNVIVLARSSFMERRPTQEQIIGADTFLSSMLSLVDAEETFQPIPGPGLIYNPVAAAKELAKQKK